MTWFKAADWWLLTVSNMAAYFDANMEKNIWLKKTGQYFTQVVQTGENLVRKGV